MNWKPTATLDNIKARARLMTSIRHFFHERNVLEVETPLLGQHTVTDPHIDSFSADYSAGKNTTHYLQTSPEYAMKRLLASGSGPIFQLCKAFRNGECGARHNPEFTMLEWYRPGFNHQQLMQEVDELLQAVLQCEKADSISYQELFIQYLQFDPLSVSLDTLKNKLTVHDIIIDSSTLHHDDCLNLLLTHCIEPHIGQSAPLFVYDFPASQAALAKIRDDNPPVAERFEAYYKGYEIANGFHELGDSKEQEQRFIKDQNDRKALKRLAPDYDQRLLKALDNSFPDCAGVAIGIDRLLMILLNETTISRVLAFDFNHA